MSWRSVVALSLSCVCACVCIGHDRELCKKRLNRWRCRLDCGVLGPTEPCVRWGSRSPYPSTGRCNYGGKGPALQEMSEHARRSIYYKSFSRGQHQCVAACDYDVYIYSGGPRFHIKFPSMKNYPRPPSPGLAASITVAACFNLDVHVN